MDETVGPGAYNIAGNILESRENNAAFNSKEQRMFENKYGKSNNPGPGTYEITNPFNDTVKFFFLMKGIKLISG